MSTTQALELDYTKIEDIEMHIDSHDAPDFCDSGIVRFTYGGREATQEEIDLLNDDRDFVYEQVIKWVY